MPTKILRCRCANEYQDRVYGKGMRVANGSKKSGDWTCTVCGAKLYAKD